MTPKIFIHYRIFLNSYVKKSTSYFILNLKAEKYTWEKGSVTDMIRNMQNKHT